MVIRYTPLPGQGASHDLTQSSTNAVETDTSDIQSGSSSISGHYTLSNRLSLCTTSGSISITVTPVSSTSRSELITESTSGSIDVTVLPRSSNSSLSSPGEEGDATLRKLFGRHTSTSGSVTIRYPQSWEGEIEASSVSGSVEVGGRDVIVDSDGTSGNRRVIKARKGKGDGALIIESTSGTVKVVVGDA